MTRIICPVHGIPDCSPMLNGCSRVILLHEAATPERPSCNLHFELPKALVLNANDRSHWAPKANMTRNLRAMGAIAARQCQPMDRAHLTIRIGYSDKRRRDDHNLMPTFKALIDGIVTGGLLVDDDREHLTGPDLRSEVAGKTGILVLDFEFREVA